MAEGIVTEEPLQDGVLSLPPESLGTEDLFLQAVRDDNMGMVKDMIVEAKKNKLRLDINCQVSC